MAEKIRLHILGVPYTITTNEYSHCAFAGKVLRFGKMMMSRNFEVYHYGIETSDIVCTKNFDVLSKNEWEELRIKSLEFANPDMSREEIIIKLNNKSEFVGPLGNVTTPLYTQFNIKLLPLLKENYRSTKTDIICLPFGIAHENCIKNLEAVCVESGIGYTGSYKNFRIFESYSALQNQISKEGKNYQHYWFVISNYYDISEWTLNLKPVTNKAGFLGRICDAKGLNIIVEIAKRMPHVEFTICGQGDPTKYLVYPNIKYLEPLCGTARSDYLSSLTVLLAPSTYAEPFCGVNVEAQLCGTPVISNDFGALVETIEPFRTGVLCHTLQDYCTAVQMALDGKFNRQYIRDRAVELYDMYNVAYKYEYAFRNILDIYNGNGGWYSNKDYLELLYR